MRRGILSVFMIGLGAAFVFLLYSTLPGRKENRGKGGRRERIFMRSVALVQPPRRTRTQDRDLPIQRWLDRLAWGTNPSVNWTITLLTETEDRSFIPEVLQRIERYRSADGIRAAKYIDLLGELQDPGTSSVLMECASDPSGPVRRAALRALCRMKDERIRSFLLEHARCEGGEARKICLDALVEDGAPEVTRFFVSVLRRKEREAVPYALKSLAARNVAGCRELIRPYLNHEEYAIRTLALQSLLRLGDEAALARLDEELASPAFVVRKNAVQNLLFAHVLPADARLQALAKDPEPAVRLLFASVMGTLAGENKHAGDTILLREILGEMALDPRPEVRQEAVVGLYRSGRKEVVLPYLRMLEHACGAELDTAVRLLTDLLKLEAAGPRLVARFRRDPDLGYRERTALLQGMISLAYTPALDLFFEVIRGRWDDPGPPDTAFPLHRIAAYKVHALGEGVLSRWLALLHDGPSDETLYLFINGARNLEDPGAADALIAIASDGKIDRALRREALLSFPFLKDPSLGKKLLHYAAEEKDRALAECAERVFWNFF